MIAEDVGAKVMPGNASDALNVHYAASRNPLPLRNRLGGDRLSRIGLAQLRCQCRSPARFPFCYFECLIHADE